MLKAQLSMVLRYQIESMLYGITRMITLELS
jgi:hypothetical protein